MSLLVRRPGLFTTVQDLGRPGFGALGVPPSGAMDAFALRLANRLVGNRDEAAGLEMTLAGPEIELGEDAWIALTGSRFGAEREGGQAPHAEAFFVRRGRVLAIGRSLEGARGYLAVRGGVDVPVILGSRSTLVTAGFGGHEGRALRAGDRLPIGRAVGEAKRRAADPSALIPYAEQRTLRVIPGPDTEAFSSAARSSFSSSTYLVTQRSDRMGIRLEGAPIER
ncbi:MAG: biotin-dependent carboxyltransferase family protein, partial [Candidatus Binatia bacterium]